MLFETLSGWVATWWWLISLVVVFAVLLIPGKRSHLQKKRGIRAEQDHRSDAWTLGHLGHRSAPRVGSRHPPSPARWVESPTRTITGKAYVTDGDGIRVARKEVRLAGLDAPEWDQKAKHQNGYWFNGSTTGGA